MAKLILHIDHNGKDCVVALPENTEGFEQLQPGDDIAVERISQTQYRLTSLRDKKTGNKVTRAVLGQCVVDIHKNAFTEHPAEADSKKKDEFDIIEPTQNPWLMPLLDVRELSQMMSTSGDPRCAENAISFSEDDGSSFIGISPDSKRETVCDLLYRTDGQLQEGAVFRPDRMEQKWAIYFYNRTLYFIRSWTRTVDMTASCSVEDGFLRIGSIFGQAYAQTESSDYTVRAVDFILRSHALGESLPAPMMDTTQDRKKNAMELRYVFGCMATFGAMEVPPASVCTQLLRTETALHFALDAGDQGAAEKAVDHGISFSTRGASGFPAIALALRQGPKLFAWALSKGADIDARFSTGATSLGIVAQVGDSKMARLLIENGADLNARDARGFTPLHRAAEGGHVDVAKMLLQAGATPDLVAEGITPWVFAVQFNHPQVADIIKAAGGR